MSSRSRIGLILAAVVVAVAAVVIATSSGDDNDSKTTATTTTSGGPTATTPSPPPPKPKPVVITLKDHAPVGGKKKLTAKKGDQVEFTVVTDTDDSIHLHGYDIEKEAKAGKPAKFSFKANIEGLFEIESHTAEHEGKPPVIAELTVNPS